MTPYSKTASLAIAIVAVVSNLSLDRSAVPRSPPPRKTSFRQGTVCIGIKTPNRV